MSLGDVATKAACRLICLLFLAVFIFPIGYVLIASVLGRDGWSLDGYALLLKNDLVLSGLKNSLILASIGTIYSLCLEIPAAYVLSQKQYSRLTNLFFMLGQFGVSLLPLYLLLKELKLLNSLWGLILPSGFSVYYTQLLRARMINLSKELEDAASLDGCGPIMYLVRICVPVMGPTIGCIGFFHVCSYWSNTLYARTFLTDAAKYPLSLVLNEILIKNRAADVLVSGTVVASVATTQMAEFALCVISTLPLIAIFMLMKKHIKALEMDGGLVM